MRAKRKNPNHSVEVEVMLWKFLPDRAKMNYELKQQEFKMLQEQQALEKEKVEAMAKQQLQTQQ